MKALLFAVVIMLAVVVPGTALPASIKGCFARVYDRTHLAQHPDQIITAVKLRIYPSPSGSHYARYFSVRMERRGEDKALHSEGYCEQHGSVTSCYVECDGGGIRVFPQSNSTILMRLGRLTMSACADEDIDRGAAIVEVTGGKDDHEFLLNRADDAACGGISQ
jgi:hypothetical protein